jgi:outer membrane protein OmpA-like peptidoglycan-associated protein
MKQTSRGLSLGLAIVLVAGTASPAAAQGLRDRLKRRAKEKVEQRVEQRAEQAMDKALDKAENAVACAVTDAKCIEEAEKAGKPIVVTDEEGNVVGHGAAAALKPGQGAWANFDFVPGDRVLFIEDFSNDRVGNFPRRLEFRRGSMQIVEWQGQRWLSDAGGGEFYINLPEVLPERFTIEFDLAGGGNEMELTWGENDEGVLYIDDWMARARAGQIQPRGEYNVNTAEQPARIRIAVDGDYLKLYADEHRVLNAPNLRMGRSNRIRVYMNGWSAEHPRMIADLRIMAGGQELYDALEASGRVATQGIYFDTGSDRLRPESTPTLEEIGEMLKAHPDLRIRIEGHTDSTGDPQSNLVLSEKRAAAVKAYLEAEHGIQASRMEIQGLGDTKPAGDNETPEGRQANRRVELVKL